jgi:hypothetical protein
MYVSYDIMPGIMGDKRGRIVIDTGSYPYTQWYPSECIWMVPGTVDPMED